MKNDKYELICEESDKTTHIVFEESENAQTLMDKLDYYKKKYNIPYGTWKIIRKLYYPVSK